MLAALGSADLLYTSYLLASHQGWEANPMMRAILESAGPAGLILAKVALLALPLAAIEWARPRSGGNVRLWMRAAIVAYALLWLWGTAVLNRWV